MWFLKRSAGKNLEPQIIAWKLAKWLGSEEYHVKLTSWEDFENVEGAIMYREEKIADFKIERYSNNRKAEKKFESYRSVLESKGHTIFNYLYKPFSGDYFGFKEKSGKVTHVMRVNNYLVYITPAKEKYKNLLLTGLDHILVTGEPKILVGPPMESV